jgi:hypothetical protein
MELKLSQLKAGKGLILGVSICTAVLLTLNGCKKETITPVKEQGIKPIGLENHPGGKVKDHTEDPIKPVGDTLPCGGFRTQTQGGWGSTPHGNNPGTYVHANFALAFPNGLTVGCTNTITLTSAQAVTDYLPAGGTPAVLKTSYTNPTGLKNNLASQLVALTLSVQFDKYDPKFSSSSVLLGNLLIGSGPFKGMKVSALLTEANKVLGGCPSSYTPAQISDALSSINENFVDGTTNGTFLVCPDKIVVTY